MTTPTSRCPFAYPMQRTTAFDPPEEYRTLRAERPVARIALYDGSEAWLITRYDTIREVLADPRFSANGTRPGYPQVTVVTGPRSTAHRTFVEMDPPEHTVYRRMLTREFMVKRMNALRPAVQEVIDGVLDDMERGGAPADLHEAFSGPVTTLVICSLLGVPYEDRAFFHGHSHTLVSQRTTDAEAAHAMDELKGYLAELLAAKEQRPDEGLLTRLMHDQVLTGNLGREDAVRMAIVLLGAGQDTTSNMLTLGTLALLEHPEQLAELRRDPALWVPAIEELLRYLSIPQLGRRRVALEDVEVDGQLIRAGEGIVTADPSGNRDERVFDDPDTLDIHRDASGHIAFGWGTHQCLGQPLARMELQLAFPALFARFPALRVAVGIEELRFKNDMANYGVHELPVAW
jgi:cytochrome P450